ncbi:MAG: hypothetical protein CSA34_01690 [Desulfobulbus propionicus]|nr:MAG: hypothetical protein CSA34_01690 [Desulfobulbus propionicus]
MQTQQVPGPGTMPQMTTQVTEPLHQYVPLASPLYGLPPQAPMPGHVQPQTLAAPPASTASPALAAGVFGLIVAGTGTMGANLHKVEAGEMSVGAAVADSLVRGAAGGMAAAAATAAANGLTSGGIAGLAVTLATATGVSYLLEK